MLRVKTIATGRFDSCTGRDGSERVTRKALHTLLIHISKRWVTSRATRCIHFQRVGQENPTIMGECAPG